MNTSLEQAIADKSATVGVIGLGYVGLPLIRAFVAAGFRTMGFDFDQAKVDRLLAGKSYIKHIAAEWIAQLRGRRHVRAHRRHAPAGRGRRPADLRAHAAEREPRPGPDLHRADRPADRRGAAARPIGGAGEHDLSGHDPRRGAADPRRQRPDGGQGLLPGLQSRAGRPGQSRTTRPSGIPKVVGGIDPASGRLAELLYGQAVARTSCRSRTAKWPRPAKILENTYRSVNIAMVNELKMLFDRMGIDVWEVIDAAKTKPFGFQAFYPGPGLGGHCIPIDPFYLTWLARRHGMTTRFIELAGEINTAHAAVRGRIGWSRR